MYPNLARLAKLFLAIPGSAAKVERVHSRGKRLSKTYRGTALAAMVLGGECDSDSDTDGEQCDPAQPSP